MVDNKGMQDKFHGTGSSQMMVPDQDSIRLSLTNMNLYSLDLGQRVSLCTEDVNPSVSGPPSDSSVPVTSDSAGLLTSAKLSELTQSFGVPILHDTSVDLKIGKKSPDIPYINPLYSSGMDGLGSGLSSPPGKYGSKREGPAGSRLETSFEPVSSVLDVHAKISSPIKLSLSKEVYEQILQTVDHLTYDAEESKLQQQTSAQRAASPPTLDFGSSKIQPESPALSDVQAEYQDFGAQDRLKNGAAVSGQTSVAEPGFLAKHVDFEVPLFEVELRGNFGEGEQGLVDLKLYDFAVQYEKNDRATTHISLRLKSLHMDDLLEAPDSKHRQIIISKPSPKGKDMYVPPKYNICILETYLLARKKIH